jgi:hypothetical protein
MVFVDEPPLRAVALKNVAALHTVRNGYFAAATCTTYRVVSLRSRKIVNVSPLDSNSSAA